MNLSVFILLLLTAALSPAATGPAAPKPEPSKAVAKVKPDAEIERDIQQRLARSKSAADGFQVKVRNGIATFEGRTSVIQRKASATRMAKAAGAKAVVNNIRVSDEARKQAGESLARRRATVKKTESK